MRRLKLYLLKTIHTLTQLRFDDSYRR